MTQVASTNWRPNPAEGNTGTLTLNTETTIASTTGAVAGIFVLLIDDSAMQDGDIIVLRSYVTVKTGGTQRLFQEMSYSHGQTEQAKQMLALPTTVDGKFTITQTAGTARAFDFSVKQL